MDTSEMFDFITIGAGCAGASAAMYATRLNMKTAMIGEMPGGLITTTQDVENWPGIKKISGPDLGLAVFEHATSFGAKFFNEKVTDIEKAEKDDTGFHGYIVKTASNSYKTRTLLFATGTKHLELGVKGEKEFASKGVSYCALCDAGFFRNKTVAVVGGGDAAVVEAMILAEKAAKVYLIVRRDVLRAEPVNAKRVNNNPKVEIKFNSQIAEIIGTGKVEKIRLVSGEEIVLDGVFISIGHSPVSELAGQTGVELNNHREIKINRKGETNLPGIYAAGDVTDSGFKQAIIASAEGVTAAFNAYEFIKKMK